MSCPKDYVPESGRKHRCRLNDGSRRCRANDVACIRRPVSVSYNFLTLVSNITIPNQGDDEMEILFSRILYVFSYSFIRNYAKKIFYLQVRSKPLCGKT